MTSATLVATAVSATSPLRQGGFARRGSLYLKTVAATPSHFLFTSASHENEARNLAANLKPFDSIPAVTGGLPFVGSMSR